MSDRRIVRLVRHGRAAAGWDTDPDPDLDPLGCRQAAALAERLGGLGLVRVVTSPLLRCRSTAAAYAAPRRLDVTIAAEVAEIPSPDGVAMSDRVDWLRAAMQGTWSQLGPRYERYRDGVVTFVRGCDDATVVFSHFVAINAVIAACTWDDRLVIRSLDNCSMTTVAIEGDQLELVESGHEADTLIR